MIDGPVGALRLHIFIPDDPARGVMVRIHGGGWVGGAPEDDEALNDHICRTCQVAIVSLPAAGGPGIRLQEQGRDLTPQEWHDFIREYGSAMLPADGEG